jgi:hypothetical protein
MSPLPRRAGPARVLARQAPLRGHGCRGRPARAGARSGGRPVTSPRAPARRYFLFRRWTRVFRSSLRCFFLAILLRRFLMTEPTAPTLDRRTGT